MRDYSDSEIAKTSAPIWETAVCYHSTPANLCLMDHCDMAMLCDTIRQFRSALSEMRNLVRPLLDKPYGISSDEDAIVNARAILEIAVNE